MERGLTDTSLGIAVTGARGYVGSRLVAQLRSAGHRVIELRRDASRDEAVATNWRSFTLENGVAQGAFSGVDVLLHCAWDLTATRWEDIERVNIEGSRRLLEEASASGVRRIVFLSTMSAFNGCRSLYGRAKLEVEALAASVGGGMSIRPGLVYGPDPGGMVGTLDRFVSRLPAVPLVGSGRQVLYLDHVEDLGRLVLAAVRADPKFVTKPLIAASDRGHTLREIAEILAAAHGRTPLMVPIPWRLVWAGLRIAEAGRLTLPLRSDSVISLMNQAPSQDFEPTRRLEARFRDFQPDTALV